MSFKRHITAALTIAREAGQDYCSMHFDFSGMSDGDIGLHLALMQARLRESVNTFREASEDQDEFDDGWMYGLHGEEAIDA